MKLSKPSLLLSMVRLDRLPGVHSSSTDTLDRLEVGLAKLERDLLGVEAAECDSEGGTFS